MENVEGKIVAITGASSGLGAESARELTAAGAKVVLGARRLEKLEALQKELGEENCAIFKLDVTDVNQVRAFVDFTVKSFGKIDVMINNAGLMPLSPLEMLHIDEWNQMIDVNIKGVLYGVAACLPYFKRQKSGHIINTASVAAHIVNVGGAVYCATKHAVAAISEGIRIENKAYNIRSTMISPGAVATELPNAISDAGERKAVGEFYSKYAVPASSYARCVVFAVSQPADVDINEILYRPTAQNL